ncbi:MAG TPA: arginase family protein [Nitrososphaeraceae archaeon]|jgi:arginase|nr:arginase family protein [Nitrososphaeraceae archaeon]
MPQFAIIDAPSILGLRPTGVQYLPEALKAAGLMNKLKAEYKGRVLSLPYNPQRDKSTTLLNPHTIRAFSLQLAEKVISVLHKKQFPIVLGGDCSILIGNLLALKQMVGSDSSRYGLFFIDGHADFYQPEASLTGEVADMDLAIVSGRGPDILTDIEGLKPLVLDQDIVVFGYRDGDQAASYGSQDVYETNMHLFDLEKVHTLGITHAASLAIEKLMNNDLAGFWIHLDVDVLDDEIMPAVDYRLDGGLSFSDLSELLKIILGSKCAVGMDITILNPLLDVDGSITHRFVSSIVAGLS